MSDKPIRRPGKVLVMDDDPLQLDIVRRMLLRLGYDALVAPDGDQAAALYAEHLSSSYPVDVVILDLKVPQGAGALETAPLIRRLDPAACLVVTSGSADHPAMVHFKEHGFRAVLAKPYATVDVGMLVGELLD